MRNTAAKGRKLSLLAAAFVLVGALLIPSSAEATRTSETPITAALGAPRVTLETLETATARSQVEPENRFRLFEDLGWPVHPLELLQVKKTASGVFDLGIQCNVWQTGGLGQNCGSPSFQGLWTDPTTGLSYARNRWYDARTASWLSEDPKGAVDSPNLYAFVGWGPHMGTDPMGLDTFVVHFGEDDSMSDVYVTLRFLRSRQDESLTEEAFSGAGSAFVSNTVSTWSTLKPKVFAESPGYVSEIRWHGQTAFEYESDSPYVTDVILESGAGRSTTRRILIGDADRWTYSHEAGHVLGLKDYYKDITVRNREGGWKTVQAPDTERFGPRASDSIMGSRERDRPTEDDFNDILNPGVTDYELPDSSGWVHHIDLSGEDLSSAVEFFEAVGAARNVDISFQIKMLQERADPEKRRRIVDWIMRELFGRYQQ